MYGTLISSVTVGAGGASTIDFTSIPGTYTDLVLVCSLRNDSGANGAGAFRINGSSSAIYSHRSLRGTGSAASSENGSSETEQYWLFANPSTYTASTFSNSIIYIPNYAGSTNKSVSIETVTENNATAAQAYLVAGLWASTSAITSLNISWSTLNGSNLAQYSTAYLYGLTKGSGGATVS